jgi:peptide/nickel transport system substrate-binding protein
MKSPSFLPSNSGGTQAEQGRARGDHAGARLQGLDGGHRRQQGAAACRPGAARAPGVAGITVPHQDLPKAKAIMEKAGLKDGFDMDMSYPTQNVYGVDMATLAQKVQQDLAKINIRVKLVPQEFSVWQPMDAAGKIGSTVGYWAPDYFGTSDYVNYFGMVPGTFCAISSGLADLPEGLNKKEIDLYKQALGTGGEKGEKLWHQVVQEMVDDHISMPLFSPDLVIVKTKDVQGVNYNVVANLLLADLHR